MAKGHCKICELAKMTKGENWYKIAISPLFS